MTFWSISLSDSRARQKSDEITSVGRKCFLAKVDLPDPVEPIRTTSEKSGIAMSRRPVLIA